MLTLADYVHLLNVWILAALDAGDDDRLDRLLATRNRYQVELDAAWDAEREVAAA